MRAVQTEQYGTAEVIVWAVHLHFENRMTWLDGEQKSLCHFHHFFSYCADKLIILVLKSRIREPSMAAFSYDKTLGESKCSCPPSLFAVFPRLFHPCVLHGGLENGPIDLCICCYCLLNFATLNSMQEYLQKETKWNASSVWCLADGITLWPMHIALYDHITYVFSFECPITLYTSHNWSLGLWVKYVNKCVWAITSYSQTTDLKYGSSTIV